MLPSNIIAKVKSKVLGPDYELSLAFIDSQTSRELNRRWRGKDQPANVLSFPLGPEDGEILIDQELAKTAKERLFLFIHGLLHLAGERHGSRMENEEQKLLKLFSHHGQTNHRRARHRHCRHSAGSR